MEKLILSTGNEGKIKEIKEILKDLNILISSKKELNLDIDVVEDEDSLEGNAIKKARAISEKVEAIVMADDTGLFVEALNGAPGIYSARYGGEDGNSYKNREKLKKELKGIEKRDAYFETVIALVFPEGRVEILKGRCEGKIAFEEKGDKGFGYDSLFIPKGYNQTFAELGDDIKNKISHRSKALEKMEELLSLNLEG